MDAMSTDPYALVVDDDALIQLHACDILEDAGFRCLQAGDGHEARDMLVAETNNVTLLFTDVEMPGSINGFELARMVDTNWPEIEIVVASGRATPRDGDLPDKAIFIAKPFSAAVVHEHLAAKLPDGKKPEPLKRAV